MSRLTQKQRKEIEDIFKMYDKNGDGWISAEELGDALKQAGASVSDSDVQTMIFAADVDGNGKIEYREFEKMMAAQEGEPMSTDDIKYYFNKFDKSGDGFITADEMKLVISTFHGSKSKYTAEDAFKGADINKDGKISFEEFQKVIDKTNE